MVSYFKNQKELAFALIYVIDRYWNNELDDEDLINIVNELADKNSNKLFKNGKYTSMVSQRLGKRRIELITKLLKL